VVRIDDLECYGGSAGSIEIRVSRTYRRRGLPRAGTVLGRRSRARRVCRRNLVLFVKLSPSGARLLRHHRRLPVEIRSDGFVGDPRYVTELVAP
jgi:hypothetical protein